MIKKHSSIAFLVSLMAFTSLITLTGCGTNTASSAPVTYQNTTTGFSVQYPGNWKKEEIDSFDVEFTSPTISGANLPATVEITSIPDDSAGSFAALEQERSDFLSVGLDNYHLISSNTTQLGGKDALHMIYTFTSGSHTMQTDSIIAPQGDSKAFAVTITRPSDHADYAQADIDALLASFTLLK